MASNSGYDFDFDYGIDSDSNLQPLSNSDIDFEFNLDIDSDFEFNLQPLPNSDIEPKPILKHKKHSKNKSYKNVSFGYRVDLIFNNKYPSGLVGITERSSSLIPELPQPSPISDVGCYVIGKTLVFNPDIIKTNYDLQRITYVSNGISSTKNRVVSVWIKYCDEKHQYACFQNYIDGNNIGAALIALNTEISMLPTNTGVSTVKTYRFDISQYRRGEYVWHLRGIHTNGRNSERMSLYKDDMKKFYEELSSTYKKEHLSYVLLRYYLSFANGYFVTPSSIKLDL